VELSRETSSLEAARVHELFLAVRKSPKTMDGRLDVLVELLTGQLREADREIEPLFRAAVPAKVFHADVEALVRRNGIVSATLIT